MELDRYMVKYSDQPQCVLCQLVMTKLEAQLKDHKTEAELESVLQGICKKAVPAKHKAQCEKFIAEYTQLIIALVDTVPPKELCGQINLCRVNQLDTSKST